MRNKFFSSNPGKFLSHLNPQTLECKSEVFWQWMFSNSNSYAWRTTWIMNQSSIHLKHKRPQNMMGRTQGSAPWEFVHCVALEQTVELIALEVAQIIWK